MAIGSGLFFALAYRDLIVADIATILASPLPALILTPGTDVYLVGLAAALWIAWTSERRSRKTDHPREAEAGSKVGALIGFAMAAAILIWAHLFRSPGLLLGSAAALLFGLASFRNGASGARRMILPAIVLIITIPIPAPLQNEFVWALQRLTATCASSLLDLAGYNIVAEGIQIQSAAYHLEIGESSSGLRFLQVLLPVSLAIGHFHSLRGDRLAFFAFLTSLAGFAFSVLHTLLLLLSSTGTRPTPSLESSTLQAAILLAVSIFITIRLARTLGTHIPNRAEASRPIDRPAKSKILICSVLFALLSLLARSPFEERSKAPTRSAFPHEAGGWTSTRLPRDYTFPYTSPETGVLIRAYKRKDARPGQASVEVFIGHEARGIERLPRNKLPLPNGEWHIAHEFGTHGGDLDATVRITELARFDETEFALVYSWRRGDAGLVFESMRALLGIDSVEWNDEGASDRVVVRIATPVASQLRSDRRRAARLLDGFIEELGSELNRL